MSARRGPDAVAVVLAAGLGTRVGADGNKAYLRIAGRSMVAWSIDTLTRVPEIARTVLVFRRGEYELARDTLQREVPTATVEFVEGGDTRHASESNVLRYLAADIDSGAVDVVIIHDAARPVAGPELFVTALSVAREFGGAIPAIPIADVIRTNGHDVEVMGGSAALVRVQTPRRFALRRCCRRIARPNANRSRAPTHRRVSRHSPISRSAPSAASNATSR